MQFGNSNKKAGVSLVTVLLFMLVATIAATATYKWLTSEGRSSASRLQQNEAYQSAAAGLDNARAWMAFHGNDVGALIKAFIDGGRKPINLDARLRSLQRAGQDYHVWLTGVNTEKSTFKLKLLASGESRNGTKHSEIAIFNVDGLYQVKVPEEKVVSVVPFKHNYFGGSTHSEGTIKAYSLLINGNLNGSNPVYTDVDLVVTGNINITGSSVGAAGNVCVGGNLNADNGVLGGDFYVGGNATGFTFPTTSEAAKLTNANVTGNVYIEGDLGPATTGDQKFQKNMTLNGTWTTNLGAHESSVAGNLCVGPQGQVFINSSGRTFKVDGNVWAESEKPIWWENGKDNHPEYKKIILGNKTSSEVYISGAYPAAAYEILRNNRTFIEKNTYYRGSANYGMAAMTWDNKTTRPYGPIPGTATDNDKYYLYNYTGPGQDVDFIVTSVPWGWSRINYANYYVGNKILYTPAVGFYGMFGYSPEKINYLNFENNKPTNTPYCKTGPDKWRPECKVTPWFKSNGSVSRNFPESREFSCAESAKAHCDSIWSESTSGCDGAKYKVNDILVTAYTKFSEYANRGCRGDKLWDNNLSKTLNACYAANSNDPQRATDSLYNGYQVVTVRHSQKSDPTTPLNGKFIIIVENAMGQQSLPPTTADSYAFVYLTEGATSTIQPATNNGIYNYFIYTKKDITGVMFNNADFSGSIYAAVSPRCAKVGDFKSRNMILNEELLSDLSANGVICEGSVAETSCGGTESSEPVTSTSSSDTPTGGTDSYYISMSPQLGVRLESQYKNDEALPKANETTALTPSFIVLPRVIYLPDDPYGKLTDYYNVRPLNGSTLKKSDVTVTCSGPGTLPATGSLYNAGDGALAKGIYSCTAAAASYSSVPFWVVVGNGTRGTPQVTFVEPASQEMTSNDQKDIKISVPAHGADMIVNLYCPDVPNESWEYLSFGTGVTRSGTTCKVALSASNAASEHTVFTIKTTNAIVGTHTAQILPGEGYIPGPPSTAQLYISASAVLDRVEATSDDIDAFCEDHSTLCPENYATRWPDCDITDVWVEPTGAYHTLMPNDSWSIMVGNTQAVTLSASSTENDCVVIIPESSNSIAANGVEANHTYTLRASAKAKKSSFKVGFKGDVGDGHTPVINIITGTVNQQCSYSNAVVDQETSAKVCVIDVFKGEAVTVALDSLTDDAKDFSYWKCSGANCPTTETVTSKKYGTFSISEDGTALIAHFGEADKHCFFDEFKSSSVACSSEDTKYCIDKCGNDDESVCTGVVDANGTFTKSKWHLISGELSQIEVGSSQEIHIDKTVNKKKKESERTSVMVLSTVTAGTVGKLKALINVPRATASYDKSATNIKYSGFMLRANTYGNDFFMLNLYENTNGELEAQLWRGDASLSSVLTNSNGVSVSVTNSSMVMVSASVTASGTIEVKANIGDYYTYDGAPTVYGYTFDLSDFNNTLADAAHEFVGFSLADPNFKIYGIGWKSDTYNSECFETFPTVKCSFAAVATDGVIKIDTLVKPWVGYSGWFDANGCSPVYYYYNGNDATTTCAGNVCTGGYQFDNSGIGAHGYTEENVEKKTAKAWLANCTKASSESVNWGVAAEDERAHCGAFWTGAFAECTAHQDLYSGNKSITDAVETITLSTKQNLRAATLRVELTNSDNSEVEIWLVSESTDWGSVDHESHSVKMNGSVGTFDVMKEFAAGSNGFDPENVKYILLKNHSTSDVSLKSITSTCANAIGITYCRAEYDGTNWNVMTQVTNKNLIASETVVATVDDDEKVRIERSASGEGGITWNGEIAFVQEADNPYAYRGKHYVFTATIYGKTAGQMDSKLCSVTPDPIGTVDVDCSVIGTIANGARYPTFNVNFSGCPSGGCGYAIYVEDESDPITSGRELTSVRFSANKTGECNSSAGCEHTYTVRSTDDDSEFEECSATFKVVRDQSDLPPTVTCGISTNNYGSYNGTFYTTDNVYFWSRNRESVEATYSLELHEGETVVGSGTLSNWSNHSVISLGHLSAGSHTYELFAKGEKICDATVVVNDRSANADLLCGVSTHNYDISGGNVFNNVDYLYFMAKNRENTNDKLTDIDVYRGTTSLATTEIATNSNWTNTYSIGALGKGTYTFKLMYGETELCSHSIEVRTIADDANLTCGVSTHNYDISGGSTFNPTDYLYFMAKNNASVNYTVDALSVYKNNVQVVASIDISASSNWTKTLDIGALDAGTYTFALKNGSQLKCEHKITVSGPSSSSSATPASSGSDETDGVICLNAQNAEANVGGSSKNANIGPGTYTFLHNCASRGWWYTCTGTKITIGSTDYSCSGSQTSTWDGGGPIDGVNSPPESGATLVVPTGTTFQNIGCSKSDNSPVDGCSTTGVSGSSEESSSSIELPVSSSGTEVVSSSSVTPNATISTSGGRFNFTSSGTYAILVNPATSSTCSISCNGDGNEVTMSVIGTSYSSGPGYYVSFNMPCQNGNIINLHVTGAVKDCMIQWQ